MASKADTTVEIATKDEYPASATLATEVPANAGIVNAIPHGDGVSDYKATFLSTFTAEEEREIMTKVDWHLLLLLGLLNLIKAVSQRLQLITITDCCVPD